MPKEDEQVSITYQAIGKKRDFAKELAYAIPKQFVPTQKTGWIAMALLLFFVTYGIVQSMLPLMDFSFDVTRGEAFELKFNVGYPLAFFSTTDNGTKIEISLINAIIDIIAYILIGYILDILMNLIIAGIKLGETEEEKRQKPKEIKFKQKSTADKLGEKVMEKREKKLENEKKIEENKTPNTSESPKTESPTPSKNIHE